jgi:hypothetical protein
MTLPLLFCFIKDLSVAKKTMTLKKKAELAIANPAFLSIVSEG